MKNEDLTSDQLIKLVQEKIGGLPDKDKVQLMFDMILGKKEKKPTIAKVVKTPKEFDIQPVKLSRTKSASMIGKPKVSAVFIP